MVIHFRVTAKGCNVSLTPFEYGDLIRQAVVPGRMVLGLARLAQEVEENQAVQVGRRW